MEWNKPQHHSMFINQYVRYSSSSSFAMAVRLYFVLLLVVVSAMAQTFQLSSIRFHFVHKYNNSFPLM